MRGLGVKVAGLGGLEGIGGKSRDLRGDLGWKAQFWGVWEEAGGKSPDSAEFAMALLEIRVAFRGGLRGDLGVKVAGLGSLEGIGGKSAGFGGSL